MVRSRTETIVTRPTDRETPWDRGFLHELGNRPKENSVCLSEARGAPSAWRGTYELPQSTPRFAPAGRAGTHRAATRAHRTSERPRVLRPHAADPLGVLPRGRRGLARERDGRRLGDRDGDDRQRGGD